MLFLKKKYIHLVVAPEPLAIWNKELEDLVLKWSALRKSFGDVRFFEEKVHSLSVAPEPLAIWNKKLEGLESLCCLKICVLK